MNVSIAPLIGTIWQNGKTATCSCCGLAVFWLFCGVQTGGFSELCELQ